MNHCSPLNLNFNLDALTSLYQDVKSTIDHNTCCLWMDFPNSRNNFQNIVQAIGDRVGTTGVEIFPVGLARSNGVTTFNGASIFADLHGVFGHIPEYDTVEKIMGCCSFINFSGSLSDEPRIDPSVHKTILNINISNTALPLAFYDADSPSANIVETASVDPGTAMLIDDTAPRREPLNDSDKPVVFYMAFSQSYNELLTLIGA